MTIPPNSLRYVNTSKHIHYLGTLYGRQTRAQFKENMQAECYACIHQVTQITCYAFITWEHGGGPSA